MSQQRKDRIQELLWNNERKRLFGQFDERFKECFPDIRFEALEFDKSDALQLARDEWPDKWKEELYLQVELNNPGPIEKELKSFLDQIGLDHIFVFFMHYNFGLVKISKQDILKAWQSLIEFDGDEIFCLNPSGTDFICIEKTEDFIVGKEQEGAKWMYDLTYSNAGLKRRIKNGI